jgi:hypothetical protein
MAELIARTGIIVNSVDLTDHLKSLELSYNQEIHDITAMDDDARNRLVGLTDASLTATYNQDYAAGSVDATHFALIGNTGFTITMRAVSTDARGATNPEYAGTFLLQDGPGPSGSAGDPMEGSYNYVLTGGSFITRSTDST